MNQARNILTALSLMLLVTGCVSSMKVQTDYNPRTDFDDYQEYRWISPVNVLRPSGSPDSLLIRQFEYAVDQELSKRGFVQTRGEGDVFVVLYRPGAAPGARKDWAPGNLVIKSVRDEGLVLEVVDIEGNVCVWRGITDEAFDSVDADAHQSKVNEAVTRMFDLFPRLPVTDPVKDTTGELP